MIEFIGKEDAISTMNKYSTDKEPFLFLTNFDQSRSIVLPLSEVSPDEIKYQVSGVGNTEYFPDSNQPAKKLDFKKLPVSFDTFKNAFDQVIDHIKYGNSFLTNLTFETPVETNMSLSEIFDRSNARYKIWLKDQFCCFSPEIFIRVKDNVISSYPMKGTIEASIPNAHDLILKDQKEQAEHVTIVDLIRNDLSMIADKVSVPDFRYIETIKTNQTDLLQVSSRISGEVRGNLFSKVGDLIFKMLPAGSISGAPKPQTMEIIRQAETHDRGFYTGVCGIFDGESLDSGVMIRFVEEREGRQYFKSGGGITYFSDPEKEYQEYISKIYLPL